MGNAKDSIVPILAKGQREPAGATAKVPYTVSNMSHERTALLKGLRGYHLANRCLHLLLVAAQPTHTWGPEG